MASRHSTVNTAGTSQHDHREIDRDTGRQKETETER